MVGEAGRQKSEGVACKVQWHNGGRPWKTTESVRRRCGTQAALSRSLRRCGRGSQRGRRTASARDPEANYELLFTDIYISQSIWFRLELCSLQEMSNFTLKDLSEFSKSGSGSLLSNADNARRNSAPFFRRPLPNAYYWPSGAAPPPSPRPPPHPADPPSPPSPPLLPLPPHDVMTQIAEALVITLVICFVLGCCMCYKLTKKYDKINSNKKTQNEINPKTPMMMMFKPSP